MINSIAEYYLTEIYDWKNSIDLHLKEIKELQDILNEILSFNTIPKLAATVEHYLNLLLLYQQNLMYLKHSIQSLEEKLYKQATPVENEMITEDLKQQQNDLRNKMHRVQKEYLDAKYGADHFVAETVIKQNDSKKNGKHK